MNVTADTVVGLAYTVEDHDLVLVDDFTDKTDVIKEDRVEIFFAVDWRLDGYYCLEIDPRGREGESSLHDLSYGGARGSHCALWNIPRTCVRSDPAGSPGDCRNATHYSVR